MATLKTRLILRNDITKNWNNFKNLILMKGEVGVEWWSGTGDLNGDHEKDPNETAAKAKLKIGDGFTTWENLPYIQDSLINKNIVIKTPDGESDANTIVDIKVEYEYTEGETVSPENKGVYTIVVTKGRRLKDVTVADDGVVNLTKPDTWNENPTITASHAEKGPTGGYTATANGSIEINPMTGGSFKVEESTVDEYGHTNKIAQQDITIQGHSITATGDPTETAAEGTVNVLTNVTAKDHTITRFFANVYTKDKIDNLINPGMEFKGVLNLTKGLASLPKDAKKGDSYKIGSVTDIAGIKIGDLIIAQKDNPNQLFNETDWAIIPAGDDVEDTWRPINVNGEELLGTGISTGNIDFIQGDGIELIPDTNKGSITIKYTGATTDTTYTGEAPIKVDATTHVISHEAPTPATISEFVKISCDETGHINNKVDVAKDDITKFFGNGTLITKDNAADKIVFNHNNSGVTKGSYGQSKDQTFSPADDTISVPYITVDAAGHITAAADHTVTLPATAYDHSYGEVNVTNSDVTTAVTGSGGKITAEADNHSFTLAAGNKWLQIKAENNNTDNKDIITLGHALGQAYSHDGTKDQTFTWDSLTAFDLDKIVTDAGGHTVNGTSNITITLPNTPVTTRMKGLAPRSLINSLLLNKDSGNPIWDSILILDGGSASTFDNKATADTAGEGIDKTNYYGRIF